MPKNDNNKKPGIAKEKFVFIDGLGLGKFVRKFIDDYRQRHFAKPEWFEFYMKKQRYTVFIPEAVIEKVKDTVYWTDKLTLSKFSESAFTFWLAFLEKKRGKPFPTREGKLKEGRPPNKLKQDLMNIWEEKPARETKVRDPRCILLTLQESADRLNISRKQAYRLCRSGELPHVRVGKSIRCKLQDLIKYIDEQTTIEWERVDERGRPKENDDKRDE